MRTASQQLALAFDEIETIRHLAGALEKTVMDAMERIRPLNPDASSRIVHQHAKKALKIALNGRFSPSERAIIRGAYNMVCRELGDAA